MDPTLETTPLADDAGGEAPPTRPDYLPEKFWNAETGTANVEALSESFTGLERKMFTKNEVLKTELASERLANRPEAADKYELPEIEGHEWDEGDPLLVFWQNHAFDQGFDQEMFNTGINGYIDAVSAAQPDMEVELARLGEDGKTRIAAINAWVSSSFSEETQNAFDQIAQSAEGIAAIEEIMGKLGGGSGEDVPSGLGEPVLTREELTALMGSPAYWDPGKRDPALIAKVTRGFERLAGSA
jgi:hypothetical protein